MLPRRRETGLRRICEVAKSRARPAATRRTCAARRARPRRPRQPASRQRRRRPGLQPCARARGRDPEAHVDGDVGRGPHALHEAAAARARARSGRRWCRSRRRGRASRRSPRRRRGFARPSRSGRRAGYAGAPAAPRRKVDEDEARRAALPRIRLEALVAVGLEDRGLGHRYERRLGQQLACPREDVETGARAHPARARAPTRAGSPAPQRAGPRTESRARRCPRRPRRLRVRARASPARRPGR